jgi:hypothetical protein
LESVENKFRWLLDDRLQTSPAKFEIGFSVAKIIRNY